MFAVQSQSSEIRAAGVNMAAEWSCCTRQVNARAGPSTGTDATWARTAPGRALAGGVWDVSAKEGCQDEQERGRDEGVKLSSVPAPRPFWVFRNPTAGTAEWAIRNGARGTAGWALASEPSSWICPFGLGSVGATGSSSRRPQCYLASWNSKRGVCNAAVMTWAYRVPGSEA